MTQPGSPPKLAMLSRTQRSAATRSVIPTFTESAYAGPADRGHIEKSEDIEAVIDRHRHYIVMSGHLRPVLGGEFIGRTEREAAAMDVEHHRAFTGQARRPDV